MLLVVTDWDRTNDLPDFTRSLCYLSYSPMVYSIVFVGVSRIERKTPGSRPGTLPLHHTPLFIQLFRAGSEDRTREICLEGRRFTASLYPHGYSVVLKLYVYIVSDGSDILSPNEDSNPGPADYKSAALRN